MASDGFQCTERRVAPPRRSPQLPRYKFPALMIAPTVWQVAAEFSRTTSVFARPDSDAGPFALVATGNYIRSAVHARLPLLSQASS